jgi:hypothetical protein
VVDQITLENHQVYRVFSNIARHNLQPVIDDLIEVDDPAVCHSDSEPVAQGRPERRHVRQPRTLADRQDGLASLSHRLTNQLRELIRGRGIPLLVGERRRERTIEPAADRRDLIAYARRGTSHRHRASCAP